MAQNQRYTTAMPMKMMILVIAMAALYGCATAQSNSSSGCTNVIVSMSPCLDYISGNSSSPSAGCCTQLATVVKSQPQCLCQVLNGGGSSLGLNINQTQALELPKACNVQTPPTSQCASTPGSSPNGSSGSGRSPTGNGSSDATCTRLAAVPLLFSLLVAAYVTFF